MTHFNKIRFQDFSRQYFNERCDDELEIFLSGILYGEDTLNADSIPAVRVLPNGEEEKLVLI